MNPAEAMATAILEIERILSEYLEPGHEQDPTMTIAEILTILDKHGAVGAAERVRQGYSGPKLVK